MHIYLFDDGYAHTNQLVVDVPVTKGDYSKSVYFTADATYTNIGLNFNYDHMTNKYKGHITIIKFAPYHPKIFTNFYSIASNQLNYNNVSSNGIALSKEGYSYIYLGHYEGTENSRNYFKISGMGIFHNNQYSMCSWTTNVNKYIIPTYVEKSGSVLPPDPEPEPEPEPEPPSNYEWVDVTGTLIQAGFNNDLTIKYNHSKMLMTDKILAVNGDKFRLTGRAQAKFVGYDSNSTPFLIKGWTDLFKDEDVIIVKPNDVLDVSFVRFSSLDVTISVPVDTEHALNIKKWVQVTQ